MLKSIRKTFSLLRRDEKGATLVEYGVALLIAITVGGVALTTLAQDVESNFDDAESAVVFR